MMEIKISVVYVKKSGDKNDQKKDSFCYTSLYGSRNDF